MALQEKYAELINAATAASVANLQVREQDNVLYIDGEAPTGAVKDQLWATYEKLDPDYRSADVVMNIGVSPAAPSSLFTVTTEKSNLNIRKGPGTDQEIIGKAAHGSTVTLLSRYSDDWSLIRSAEGVEGYSSTQYLTAV
jgi:uncharacterized protein YgiM (DUF1202 family)